MQDGFFIFILNPAALAGEIIGRRRRAPHTTEVDVCPDSKAHHMVEVPAPYNWRVECVHKPAFSYGGRHEASLVQLCAWAWAVLYGWEMLGDGSLAFRGRISPKNGVKWRIHTMYTKYCTLIT
jgi:hypothetical protein